MQALKDFWEERLGFDPFMMDGSIEIKKDETSIYLETKINEQTEKNIRLLISRMLKTQVSISCFKKMSLDEFADDWQNIISGNNLQEYLKLLYPQVSEKSIVFKTSSSFAVERIKRMKESFDVFLHNCISGNFTYSFEIDESMKPIEAKKEFEPTSAKQSEKNILLIGKDFKKLPMPIESIPMSEGSYIVTKGRIFSKEYNDKVRILTFYITDESASFIVKVMNDNAETLNSKIKVNDVILIDGVVNRDNYINDYVIRPFNIKMDELPKRQDVSTEKRVELHVHSKLSSMDGTMDIQNIVSIVKEFGHKAVAITDHGVVQSIPEFYDTAVSNCIKPIFGTESYVVDDFINIIKLFGPDREVDSCEYVVFDFETTGLIPWENEIIEIGAVKVKNNVVIDRFHSLVKPIYPVPPNIVQITGITNEMVESERSIEQVLPEFLSFIENSVLVAHNADFDYRFLRVWIKKILNVDFEQTYIDTLSLSKSLLNLSGYSLDKVVQALGLGDFNHHRADEDAHVTALAFIKLIEMAKARNLTTLKDFENLKKFIDYKSLRPFHMTILVKNKTGLKNLYKLISNSHIEHFYRVPRILKSELVQFREGLLIGSGCGFSEMAESFIRAADRAELVERAKFYDYIELMPIEAFESGDQISAPKVAEFYRLMHDISKELGIPAVMTGNVHYAEKGHKKFHDALRFNDKRQPTQALRYFRTTGEMLEQAKKIFNSDSVVKEVVIENSNKIADMIEDIKPLTKKLNPPKIEGAEETVKEMSLKKAIELYGDPLPEIVKKRVDRELDSIIKHGYAVLYLIAQKIVKKSNDDGYVVGSRGSVGSSIVATLMGITEVNPLSPHYHCPKCKYSEFFTNGEYGSGYDLPDKNCPKCGEKLLKNGQEIPFETFMGFEGDKVPDIDLNFSGEYQNRAHKYIEELFGEDYVFRAGTISTVAERTAYLYAKDFAESQITVNNAEIQRIASAITGVKRTTGQHPGGLMIVPRDRDIFEFTPIQYPANDSSANQKTTHFDYPVIHDDLIKLDALGHDDPTFIRKLYEITGIDPQTVPMDDKQTMEIFSSCRPLKIDLKKELDTSIGALGIPEFGTTFVRRMLEDTKPSSFSDLIRISGLSHGTDVWAGNAQVYIKTKQATLSDVIACRDDIMISLIQKGVDNKTAFKIMEKVRKGKGIDENDESILKKVNMPQWFLSSCKSIKYLFPKAHAAAYVSMAFRIAYFKVHHPLAFYATFFSVKGDEFNLAVILKGKEAMRSRITFIRSQEQDPKKKNEAVVLESAIEMVLRGFSFLNVDLYKSDSFSFTLEGQSLRVPFIAIPNLGQKAVEKIVTARKDGEFRSIEDLVQRTSINKTNVETLKEMGVLKGMPDSNQMGLFG